ncbi:sigma-54-dependent Fis family transcriptional regulator [Pseudomonas sp. MAC6]|uniref:sigma-54-dependent Fis family transcriptional regulator n=1 Tax=Pseudomonas sp. MAC6 TaxID=3401633 RepID=UPI003BF58F36
MEQVKTQVPISIAHDLQQRVREVRKKLIADGQLPLGVLREEIDASWRRSISYGLNCIDKESVGLHRSQDLELLLATNRLLIDAATPELEYLVRQMGKGSLIVLGNADATVLAVDGHHEYLKTLDLPDMQPGACWSEALRGTNALGTTLVDARATLINRDEHYLDRLSRFSCTAVPIKDPQGKVIGVLDLTRDGPMVQPQDILATLMLAARNIESRLFGAYYTQDILLAFHSRQQYLGSAWHGLLAIGLNGEILAANEEACDLLQLTRDTLVGRPSSDFLGSGSLSRLLRNEVSTLQTTRGELFFKPLQTPRCANLSVATSATRTSVSKQQSLNGLAGEDGRLARSLRMAQQGLANHLPVLLLGETGTGKEVIARALHQASARAEKPFIAINCAAIPEGLIESELFGYRDGAFTGSRKGGAIGRLMQAHGGTLFLDEIGDMPLSMQARLLRVLQERKVAPLGAAEEQDIDVAVICATHRDLKRLVQEKSFREDLYYRINGINLRLPALRERDALPAFIDGLLQRLGAEDISLDKELGELLFGYDWPGNIRQLEMVLRVALAMCEKGEKFLGVHHLTDSLLDELMTNGRRTGSIRENELELIRSSLECHQGNVSAAADALGISRATLYRKLKQLQS